MICDMCGSEGKLYKAIIEGAQLNVCQECSKFGKVIGVIKQEAPRKIKSKIGTIDENKEPQTETMQIIVSDYAEKIKKKRETLGLKQEEFAKKINEKESLVHNVESGRYEPSIELAKKIERFLKIKLIEDYEEKHETLKGTKTDSFILGNFIKTRK